MPIDPQKHETPSSRLGERGLLFESCVDQTQKPPIAPVRRRPMRMSRAPVGCCGCLNANLMVVTV